MMDTLSVVDTFATPAPFETWLALHAPEAHVGVRSDDRICPLARYLNSLGYPNARVESNYIYLDNADEAEETPSCATPEWAVSFQECVDAGEWAAPVTAAEALRYLAWRPAYGQTT